MKMKVKALFYQRNGISGEGFFTAYLNNLTDHKGNFIATFVVNERSGKKKKDILNTTTCRVNSLDEPLSKWRGDNIGADIQAIFEKSGFDNYYDWGVSFTKPKVN